MADCFTLPNAEELAESIRKEIELIHGGKIMGCSIGTELCLIHAADAIEQLVSKCNHLAEENAKLKSERDDALKRLAFISAAVGLEVVKEEEDAD